MTDIIRPAELDWTNPFIEKDEVYLGEYLDIYKNKITQESERLFVREFLFPLLGCKNIKYVVPQYPFIDSEGRTRRIDFGLCYNSKRIALEVNGETYHAEGIIPNEMFDDNLNRQNEILNAGWFLLRYSYSQLQSPEWRQRVSDSLFYLLRKRIPELLSEKIIEPNYLQGIVLDALRYYRGKSWKKGIVVLPTGTGKTFLSAFDTLNVSGRILFIVHRLDILSQSREAFEKIYPNETLGLFTGEIRENVENSKVLFASKDSLYTNLDSFRYNEFDYIIVDEVHHGQAATYQHVLTYFQANFFMLGLTATPDRMDRKDIFELFDYQKIHEYPLNQAIEDGFLVPYSYYGLKDNIDYNNIRYNGTKYSIADLDRTLIINDRNEKIFEEYLTKGGGNKAIGFCCSRKHANAMAEFFNSKGIPAVAIISEIPNREELIQDFRNNQYNVAFTVDLFNEGVDFPDVRTLLFLRPTESKTVFFQQLGRGLRLCGGKENVVIIDFIGNYKKANNIRKYLSNNSNPKVNPVSGRVEKIEYEYSPKCEVIFDAEVEQILDRQDTSERDITKEDLIDAYYTVAEILNRKPTQEDINQYGEFKIGRYLTVFGSWVSFLKEIGEHTEASYHFPQGTHLGHIMYILYTVGKDDIKDSYLAPKYVKFDGGYDVEDGIDKFQRQTKYKLQAAMELGLLVDYREDALSADFELKLTKEGQEAFDLLYPALKTVNFSFKTGGKAIVSWEMNCEGTINETIRNYLDTNLEAKIRLRSILLKMDAVNLLLKYLYAIARTKTMKKPDIYIDFFEAPFVKEYTDRNGIKTPTFEESRRRVPFLLNILEALDIINQGRSEIEILSFIPTLSVMQLYANEFKGDTQQRITKLYEYRDTKVNTFEPDEMSHLREAFGADFLTENYYLEIGEI